MNKDYVSFDDNRIKLATDIDAYPDFTELVASFYGPCLSCLIQNNSNARVLISYDGITPHDYLMSMAGDESKLYLNFCRYPNNFKAAIPKGKGIYLSLPAWGIPKVRTGYISYSGIIKL